MNFNITLIKGDGIGPEIIDEAVKVLNKISEKYNHTFNFNEVLAGGVGECARKMEGCKEKTKLT